MQVGACVVACVVAWARGRRPMLGRWNTTDVIAQMYIQRGDLKEEFENVSQFTGVYGDVHILCLVAMCVGFASTYMQRHPREAPHTPHSHFSALE